MEACLVLEDGTILTGEGFGVEGEVFGELVFNTSMCGYQEALTDPSYNGQILMLTYPLIGNYGVNSENFESDGIKAEGFVVREHCSIPIHRNSEKTLQSFLEEEGIPGISGIDTRMLTRKIRVHGTMKGALKTSAKAIDGEELLERAREQKDISELDLVKEVTCNEIQEHEGKREHIVLIDCGTKRSILNNLLKRGLKVTAVPATTSWKDIKGMGAEGIVVSNGPGDPMTASYVTETLKPAMEKLPTFGICLGHQLMALASGASTYKLKFGHRGSNQPVKDTKTGKVYITPQNHGFAVEAESLEGTGFEVSHINLNDKTVEGIRHRELPLFSVQYHPEAHLGPRDSEYIFDEFLEILRSWK